MVFSEIALPYANLSSKRHEIKREWTLKLLSDFFANMRKEKTYKGKPFQQTEIFLGSQACN